MGTSLLRRIRYEGVIQYYRPIDSPDHFGSNSFIEADPDENTREQIKKVKSRPWIAEEIPVRSLIFDVDTGRSREVKVLEHEKRRLTRDRSSRPIWR